MVKDPVNIYDLQLGEVHSATNPKVRWRGNFPSYGGNGSTLSATVYFTIAPGERLGGHVDTTEETQFFVSGKGQLLLDGDDRRPVKAGDVVVLAKGVWHDLLNDGTETLGVFGFFSAPYVNQHFDDVMLPGNSHVTGTPNSPEK